MDGIARKYYLVSFTTTRCTSFDKPSVLSYITCIFEVGVLQNSTTVTKVNHIKISTPLLPLLDVLNIAHCDDKNYFVYTNVFFPKNGMSESVHRMIFTEQLLQYILLFPEQDFGTGIENEIILNHLRRLHIFNALEFIHKA